MTAGTGDVVTGEAVALDLRVARLGSRGLALGIDLTIQLGALLLLAFGLGQLAAGSMDPALAAAVAVVVLVAVVVGYPVAWETLARGRTPGKAALGLRVVRDDGGPIRFRQALVRGLLGFFVDIWLTAGLGAIVAMLLSPRSKRVGDVLAGTVVLQERVPARGGPVAAMPPQLAGWAATADLSALSDDLALAARGFLARAAELHPAAREDMGRRITAAVAAAVAPPAPPGTPPWAFLSAVLAERRRREELRLAPAAAPPAAPPATPPAAPAPVPPEARTPPAGGGFQPPS